MNKTKFTDTISQMSELIEDNSSEWLDTLDTSPSEIMDLYDNKWNKIYKSGDRLAKYMDYSIAEEIVNRKPKKLSDLEGIKGLPLDGWVFSKIKENLIDYFKLDIDINIRKRVIEVTNDKYVEYYKRMKEAEESNEDTSVLLEEIVKAEALSVSELNKIQDIISKAVSEKGILPYQVFGNKDILTLLYARPKSMEELEGLKGFPANGARVEKYGEDIINVFNPSREDKGQDANLGFFGFQ